MTSDLLREIEQEAVLPDPHLPNLLRKCIALGGQSGSVALREWATRELKGYGEGDALPSYRVIPAFVAIDRVTTTHRVSGQQISPASLPDIARDHVKEEVQLPGPIAVLTDAIRDARTRGDDYIDFAIPGGASLTALTNDHFRTKGVQYQTIERIYHRTSVTSLVGVVDTVLTNLVELVAELRAGIGGGSTVPDKALTDRAVNIVIYGDRNRVDVAQAVAEAGGRAEVQSATGKESKGRVILVWAVGIATVVGAVIALLVWHPW
jgi:hypothetical protein